MHISQITNKQLMIYFTYTGL